MLWTKGVEWVKVLNALGLLCLWQCLVETPGPAFYNQIEKWKGRQHSVLNKALNFKYNFSVECSFAIKIIPQYGVISNLYLIPFIFWLPHPTLHRALYSTFHLIIFFGQEQKVTFRVCVHLSNWHYALKSEFLYTRLHQIVLKKNLLDLQQCKFERSPQSKLDRGCNEAKSVNFKSRAQTPLKEV